MTASRFRLFLFGVFIGLAGLFLNLTPLGMALEEKYGLYWLFQLRGAAPAPDDVVIIAIDQPSAMELDLPISPRLWPRDLHARLIEKVANAGARVIVFDLLFEKPSILPQHDNKLARAIQKAGNVVVVERLDIEEVPLFASQAEPMQVGAITASTVPLLPIIATAAMAHAPFPLPRATSVNAYWTFKASAGDIPTLPVAAFQAYTITVYDDFIRLLGRVNPSYMAALPADNNALAIEGLISTMRQVFANEPQITPQLQAALKRDTSINAEKKRMLSSLIRLYAGGEMRYLNFYGPPRSIQTIPYYQVLQEPGDNLAVPGTADFNGKAVFIGFSAATSFEQDRIRDDYHTVFSNYDGLTVSGVEIAATAFANLLEDKPVRLLPYAERSGLLFLLGFILGIVFLVFSGRNAMLFGVVLVSIYAGYASFQFAETGTWLPLFIPLFMQFPLAVIASFSLNYYREQQEHKQIEEQFERFLPERVVRHIKESVSQITPADRLVSGVCLTTDIANYTPLSEKMNPAQLSQLMNDYYAALFEPVEKYGGDVSDVVGDAMLALWTASHSNLQVRQKACLACLDIATAVDRFNLADNRPKLITRFGLHSGEIMLGRVGDGRHFEYRAVGDVVNTANRIQAANKKLGTRLLLSNEVVADLDDFLIRPLGDFLLTGKSLPVGLAELVAHKQAASSEQRWLCEIFAQAMQAYHTGKWQQAQNGFSEILKVFPYDGPAQFFSKRCQQHEFMPSVGSWPAAIQMSTK
ncbi:MAG: hypothetical protein NMNS01_30360 [Nitrosomonas sp.]|nr:MAG: hypothetical protein NMNS01_30360 [Nitrosomonas sp.]